MKTLHGVETLLVGLVLIMGGMLASNPQVPDTSALARIPGALAPWLLVSGGLVSIAGFLGMLGVIRPHQLRQHRPRHIG